MKLLIATDCLLPRWDGIARFLSEILPYLKKRFEITVIAPNYKGVYNLKGVKIVRLKTFTFKIGDYKPTRPEFKTISKLVKKSDFVWAQTIGPIGALAILMANRQKKKVISYVHSLEWDLFVHSISLPNQIKGKVRDAAKAIVRYIYNRCDYLMVPSKEIGRTLSRVGIKTKKRIITLATDYKTFKPPRSRRIAKEKLKLKNQKVIGFCGRIGREKDLPTLIRAFKLVEKKEDDVKLLIVGEGVNKILKKFKSKNIIKTGVKNDVVPYLQAMDIFVLPSLTETSSLATMEAMSCGCAVIATKVGYVKKYIINDVNGLFFQKQNYTSLSKKILSLLRNDKRRLMLGRNARKTIVSKYSWYSTANTILDHFKSMGF